MTFNQLQSLEKHGLHYIIRKLCLIHYSLEVDTTATRWVHNNNNNIFDFTYLLYDSEIKFANLRWRE